MAQSCHLCAKVVSWFRGLVGATLYSTTGCGLAARMTERAKPQPRKNNLQDAGQSDRDSDISKVAIPPYDWRR